MFLRAPNRDYVLLFRRLRSLWRRIADWWTGGEVDQAWAELHTASQSLLAVQAPAVVKSQLADMAATVVTALDPGDLRRKDYLRTLELLAPADRDISPADRAQLRAIRQACDSSADGGHADARAFRNTLILVGSLLAYRACGCGHHCLAGSRASARYSPPRRPVPVAGMCWSLS